MPERAQHRSDEGLRRVLNARLTALARDWGWTREQVRDAFVVQLFVGRLARRDPDGWVLKGGAALQLRSPEARPTADADLAARREQGEIRALLASCAAPIGDERGEFEVHITSERRGTHRGAIRWRLGGAVFWQARIDISFAAGVDWSPDTVSMTPMISGVQGFDSLPPIPVVPPEQHLADKIAATVELHGPQKDRASTRSHDLADIVIMSRCVTVDAGKLRDAIRVQETVRGVTIGPALVIPDPSWEQDYVRRLQSSRMPAELKTVQGALAHANAFLRPILGGRVTAGTWNPAHQYWAPPTTAALADDRTATPSRSMADLIAEDLKAALEARARADGRTEADLIREALAEKLRGPGKAARRM